MGLLGEAVEAADERKRAVLPGMQGIAFTETDFQDRAILSGFDIDHDELAEIALNVGRYFQTAAWSGRVDLRTLFCTAWIDGLLVGLLAGKAAE